MPIGLRIFLGYFLIVGLGAYFLISIFMNELKPGVRQSTEETLVDTANLLAELVADEVRSGTLAQGRWRAAVDAYTRRKPAARIGTLVKTDVNHRIYVTDERGIVQYDSTGRDVGKDYSRWNDVYLTLRGEYGARSTRTDPADELSSVMHVAAPIKDGARIIGVVTVAKPNITVQPIIEKSRQKLARAGLVLMLLSLAVGIGFSSWLSRAIRRLGSYAGALSEGRRLTAPRLPGELAALGQAVSHMRSQLDGKSYVEQYVHSLTHEMKSPVAAIRGAAELLDEEMPPGERTRFHANIRGQASRLQQVVDRALDLAMVEQRQALDVREQVDLRTVVADLLALEAPRLQARTLTVEDRMAAPLIVNGDPFLLRQAIGNLLDNAVAFAPAAGVIQVSGEVAAGRCRLTVHNRGSAIPPFAQDRVFERFYSLPRPDTGQKSTGLGLPFVKEVAVLHGGDVRVENHDGGVAATLSLPAA